uniref:NRDE family protein n=1 Tax=Meloidogyne hapla TaxID=6305 RepID=A0A1I8BCD9_MELHA
MCITFLINSDKNLILGKFKLILLNNRDEGRDERDKERGTWLGIDKNGRIGNLLSITEPKNVFKSYAPSRGLHVFSNSPRNAPFKKAIYGEKLFFSLIDQFSKKDDFTEKDLINGLFEISSNKEIHFPDEQIRLQTGFTPTGTEYKMLCSIFVDGHLQGRNYGTKSTSIILIDKEDKVTFYERRVTDITKDMNDPSKFEYSVERFLLEND